MNTPASISVSETYYSLKSELVELLEQAKVLGERHADYFLKPQREKEGAAEESAAEAIAKVSRRLNSEQFNIVLCGAFACGKSTTFNALCGGRKLSPVGFGIRTSGCIVKAINLPDKAADEYAEIHWKSPEALVLGIADLLGSRLATLAVENDYDLGGAVSLKEWFKLDDPKHLKWLKKAIADEFEIYERRKGDYKVEDLDILRVSKLIADNAACEKLNERCWEKIEDEKLQAKVERMSVEEAKAYIAFPTDWDDKWLEGIQASFSLEAISFLFVQEVKLHVHAPHLERLGCALVDAPGLFASSWDTMVAQAAFRDADAIFFMFDGSRQITASDIKILKEIKSAGGDSKVFIGCNLRAQELEDTEKLLKSSLNKLTSVGFDVREDSVAIYQARMALNSRLIYSFVKQSEHSAHATNNDDYVRKILREIGKDLYSFPDAEIPVEKTIESAEAVYQTSQLPDLINRMETFILSRKARFALVECGSSPLKEALKRVEGGLRLEESSANRKVEDEKAMFDEAEKILNDFEGRVAVIMQQLAPNSKQRQSVLDDHLLNSLKDKLRHSFEEDSAFEHKPEGVGTRLVNQIIGRTQGFKGFAKTAWNTFSKEKRETWIKEEVFIPALEDTIIPELKTVITNFINEIEDAESESSQRIYGFIQSIQIEIQKEWEKMDHDNDVLQGINYEELPLNIYDGLNIRSNGSLGPIVNKIDGSAIHALFSKIAFTVTATVIALVAGWFALILVLPILYKVNKVAKNKVAKAVQDSWPDLKNAIYESTQEGIRNDLILPSLGNFQANIETNLKKPRMEYKSRRKRAEDRWKKADDERQQMAQKAKRIRTGEMKPLREKTERFVEKACQAFPLN